MSDNSSIEWTDATWNPVRGCSRVSEGCRNCYAERVAARFSGRGQPFDGFAGVLADVGGFGHPIRRMVIPRWTGRVELVPEALDWPLRTRRPKWVREAEERGERPRVFVNSMSDLFHEKLSDEDIAAVFGVMAAKPEWDFLVLTKRAERMRRWFEALEKQAETAEAAFPADRIEWRRAHVLTAAALRSGAEASKKDQLYASPIADLGWPLPNVWLGVSVEDQATADERIPHLLATPAAVRFVSYEPALAAVDFDPMGTKCRWEHMSRLAVKDEWPDVWTIRRRPDTPGIDWLIFGGESGPGARPCDIAWARSARDQCKAPGVAFYCKQLGAWPFAVDGSPDAVSWSPNGRDGLGVMDDLGQIHLRDRKGGDLAEWPEDLKVREFPR